MWNSLPKAVQTAVGFRCNFSWFTVEPKAHLQLLRKPGCLPASKTAEARGDLFRHTYRSPLKPLFQVSQFSSCDALLSEVPRDPHHSLGSKWWKSNPRIRDVLIVKGSIKEENILHKGLE